MGLHLVLFSPPRPFEVQIPSSAATFMCKFCSPDLKKKTPPSPIQPSAALNIYPSETLNLPPQRREEAVSSQEPIGNPKQLHVVFNVLFDTARSLMNHVVLQLAPGQAQVENEGHAPGLS